MRLYVRRKRAFVQNPRGMAAAQRSALQSATKPYVILVFGKPSRIHDNWATTMSIALCFAMVVQSNREGKLGARVERAARRPRGRSAAGLLTPPGSGSVFLTPRGYCTAWRPVRHCGGDRRPAPSKETRAEQRPRREGVARCAAVSQAGRFIPEFSWDFDCNEVARRYSMGSAPNNRVGQIPANA